MLDTLARYALLTVITDKGDYVLDNQNEHPALVGDRLSLRKAPIAK